MVNKILPYNPKLKSLARELRNNSTLSEVLLWKQIKGNTLGYEFHRQVPIDNYIVDFFCHELFLAIEIDGSSHDLPDGFEKDLARQQKLEGLGVNFIRIQDLDVKKNLDSVLVYISKEIERVETER